MLIEEVVGESGKQMGEREEGRGRMEERGRDVGDDA
jgi:hypothetical protein